MGKYLKNILLTGGLGYLGGRVTKYFSDNGYSIRITTRKSENDFPKMYDGSSPQGENVCHINCVNDDFSEKNVFSRYS